MNLRKHPDFDKHEEITFFADPASGLKAIVARHRIWNSPSVGASSASAKASVCEPFSSHCIALESGKPVVASQLAGSPA